MIGPADMAAAAAIGLTGSTHCIAMCGGIAGALSLGGRRDGRSPLPMLLLFHLGRLLSYALIGAALGGLVAIGTARMDALAILLRLAAGLLLIAMGCYVANWWPGLTRLEALGAPVWRHLQPAVRRLLPVRSAGGALLLGSLWGWLPCGLVYSALAWAATAETALDAGARMLCFGLGTLPAMFTLSLAGDATRRLLQHRGTRRAAGALLIIYGVWTLALPLQRLLAGDEAAPHQHHHRSEPVPADAQSGVAKSGRAIG